MAKKIKDEHGNVYVQKKPFYKRLWFIILAGLLVIGVIRNLLGGEKTESTQTAPSTNVSQSSAQITTETEVTEASSTSSESSQPASDFTPTDSSDTTIESINTYDDYMKMYEFIVNEYIVNYENMVNQYGLGDASMYQSMRDSVTQSVEQQRQQYGALGNAPIVGKEDIIQFLKEYRDNLQAQIEQMSAALGG